MDTVVSTMNQDNYGRVWCNVTIVLGAHVARIYAEAKKLAIQMGNLQNWADQEIAFAALRHAVTCREINGRDVADACRSIDLAHSLRSPSMPLLPCLQVQPSSSS